MKLRIATRGSRLALWQAEHVARMLAGAGHEPEIVVIRTTGDRRTDVPLAAIGGKGLFIKELEESLLAGESDVAVHSLKDVPSIMPEAFVLAAFPQRADPRDAWLNLDGWGPDDLDRGAVVATGAPRRRAQLLARWPHLVIEGVRGNVDTRLRALESRAARAMVLAMAGLERLGLAESVRSPLDPEVMTPAAGQGVLALETRVDREDVIAAVRAVNDPRVEREALAERHVLQRFGTMLDCHSAIAVHARHGAGSFTINAFAGAPDGSAHVRASHSGEIENWSGIADRVYEALRDAGARALMDGEVT